MCGFAGFLSLPPKSSEETMRNLQAMGNSLQPRGPDAVGYWHDLHIGFAHRRLKIVDLSHTGAQPMHSRTSRFVIVFNGEIYNHLELREQLTQEENLIWAGSSDTETLLACIDTWGLSKTLQKIEGMFSFALWDKKLSTLVLCRDRIGEKPLYYGWQGSTLLFASELKALKNNPAFHNDLDEHALTLFLKHNFIPFHYSIYKNTFKLKPGHYLFFDFERRQQTIDTYWSIDDLPTNCFQGNETEAINTLNTLLTTTINKQMRADVPVGMLLSGGIDSSLIAAMMQAQTKKSIQTFSVGFDEPKYDEACYAQQIARYLQTDHYEFRFTIDDAKHIIPRLPVIYDEPFADASQIPTHFLALLTKQYVKVALSGDGSDELFGGYTRYQHTIRCWETLAQGHVALKKLIKTLDLEQNLDKVRQQALFHCKTLFDVYQLFTLSHLNPHHLLLQSKNKPLHHQKIKIKTVQDLMNFDLGCYLPDDILVKVDRASMSAGIEFRAPFLNHLLIEYALNLPISMKLHQNQSKWMLRCLLNQYMPRDLFERPKMGFRIPFKFWLKTSLYSWANNLLNQKRLIKEQIFDAEQVAIVWLQYQKGNLHVSQLLWNILMFQAWLEVQ